MPPMGGEMPPVLDCAGIPDGDALLDMCDTCDENPNNDCIQDCSGEWGGERILNDCGECLLPNESSCIPPNIIGHDGFLSGEMGAPMSCIDGELTMGETMIDCGGNCASCDEVSLETLAVRVAAYYQTNMFPTSYVINAIHQIKRQYQLIYVHYSYALPDQLEDSVGQDTRIFGLDTDGQVISHADQFSGEALAPLSCGDGMLNMGETGLDCGGPCRPCDQLHRAELGLRIKHHYDYNGPWVGEYVLSDLVTIQVNASSVDALYGYADPSTPMIVMGYDSRRFNFE